MTEKTKQPRKYTPYKQLYRELQDQYLQLHRKLSEPRPASPAPLVLSSIVRELITERNALQARVAELEAAQRWIPVGERLPEARQMVLVVLKSPQDPIYAFLTTNQTWRTWGGTYGFGSVSHWMPLPEPPHA